MIQPFKFDTPRDGPAIPTWIDRFTVCLKAECSDLLGDAWQVEVNGESKKIVLQGPERRQRLAIPLHPGSHVVTPMNAAQRYADQLQLAAITRGFIDPPEGVASADEDFFV